MIDLIRYDRTPWGELARFARLRVRNFSHQTTTSYTKPQVLKMASMNLTIGNLAGTGDYSHVTFREATKIPADVRNHMPDYSMAIPLLLSYTFPTVVDVAVALPRPTTSITDVRVSKTVNGIFAAPIPPRKWRFDLEVALRDLWASHQDVSSIRHPTSQDLYLPLWAFEFWDEMVQAIEQQKYWKRALTWVMSWQDGPERARVIELFGSISWGMEIGVTSSSDSDPFIGNISNFLTFDWLGETHMNVAADVFNVTGPQEWWVCSASFVNYLQLLFKDGPGKMGENPLLKTTMQSVVSRNVRYIMFPVNIDNVHWVVAHVDLQKHEYTYGMLSHSNRRMPSRSPTPPYTPGDSLGVDRSATLANLDAALEAWLNPIYDTVFICRGWTVPIGNQDDGSSCGACVLNAIDHAIFGTPLFTPNDRHLVRMGLFAKVVGRLLDTVGTLRISLAVVDY